MGRIEGALGRGSIDEQLPQNAKDQGNTGEDDQQSDELTNDSDALEPDDDEDDLDLDEEDDEDDEDDLDDDDEDED